MSANCKDCTLSGNKTVGRGTATPKIMFVGESPGAAEERQGIPFVGKDGKILQSILNYLQLTEEDYYITNVCMCRPPENRSPTSQEIECCFPRLMEVIRERNPKVIVTFGATAMTSLFGSGKKISQDRGKQLRTLYVDIPGIATYHPAATLFANGDTLFPYILGDIQKALMIADGKQLYSTEEMDTTIFIADTDDKMNLLLTRLYNLPKGTHIAFDWETTGLNPLWSTGFCLGLSWKEGTGVAIPLNILRRWGVDLEIALSNLNLVGFNAVSFDLKWNRLYGLPDKVFFDPMLWHYLLDERPQRRSLENLSSFYLGAPCYESEMMAKYKAKKATMITDIPEEVIMEYCAKDVDWTLRLHNFFQSSIEEEPELQKLYYSLLYPAAKAFVDIEHHGVWVDTDRLKELEVTVTTTLIDLLKRMQKNVAEDFNPNSHKQVQTHLWDTLELDQPNIYGRADRSADKETMKALAETYPDVIFVQELMQYREMFTLYSRYIKGMWDYIEADNRVRASYHFDRTETGRLSTTHPAIHQIPRDGAIRSVFGAPPGSVLVQADYEQIEVRMAAHVAQDDKLTEMLKSGVDFHSYMASQALGITMEEVTKEQRQAAKVLSFGLLYLMSDKGLIALTGLPRDEAHNFIQSYKNLMPDVQKWIENTKADIRTKQYITSPFGRRRRFPLITPDNIDGLYREGVNFPIQSGASDITLSSLVKLHNIFNTYYPEAKIVIMVHDSIIVECPEHIAEEIAQVMKENMEEVSLDTNVPFPVDVKIGRRWGE